MPDDFPLQPTLAQQARDAAQQAAAQPVEQPDPWWKQLLRSLRLMPKLNKTKDGKLSVGAEIKGGFKF